MFHNIVGPKQALNKCYFKMMPSVVSWVLFYTGIWYFYSILNKFSYFVVIPIYAVIYDKLSLVQCLPQNMILNKCLNV